MAPPPKLLEAVRFQYLSWTRLLEDWIEAEGVEKVRARLMKNASAVSKRFAPARFIPAR
jgi:hypothetical protein